ncbi:MAG: S-layer homology domain-containing protein, partial [Syntrophomonadaceae bacterium]
MLKYRSLTYLVLAVFALTICAGFGTTQAYAAITLSDVSGHWAQSQIESLVEQNVVSGYPDNTFKPDNPVTRVEFMVMANRAFSFTNTANIDYSDVPADAWYAPEVAKAKAAGYISGYQDGSMKPNNQISRQEAAAMIARALQLDTTGDIPLNFTDAASIPTWSKNAIAAVAKAGCISGYPDGTFKATNSITRAEAVIMLSRSMAVIAPTTTYDKAGTYGPETGKATVEGNVTISAPGVVLQNTEITGNLLIAESVGEGDVTLKNVTVKGTTTVKGGGENSIKVENC